MKRSTTARASSLLLVAALICSYVHPLGPAANHWGKALRTLARISWVMAAGSSSEVGTGGGCSWGWRLRRTHTSSGTHLLCRGQDGLGVEGSGDSRDAAHDKEVVDAGTCAVVFRAVGGHGRGDGFVGIVFEGVRVVQALQP
jgi:hypothetical protein